MLRRFVLVGLMVLWQGSMLQIIVGTLLAAVFLLFQVQSAPYLELGNDFLASASSFCLVVMFLISYAFKDASLIGLDEVQTIMSKEQRELFVVRQSYLVAIMMGAVIGTLGMSAVLFCARLRMEVIHLRIEARIKKMRRLRYKADDTEVAAPSLESSLRQGLLGGAAFHLFLSHVWGTGALSPRYPTP